MLIPKALFEEYDGSVKISDALVRTETDDTLENEEYYLTIEDDEIVIRGGSLRGIMHGKNSFIQLNEIFDGEFPKVVIHDKPAFDYRAFHLDSARHMISTDEIKKMILIASHFKFNVFHWHLTDDQGWRIESKAFPLLHEVGAVRAGDHFGAFSSDEEEGGYYTRDEIKEIVAYAMRLGIDIVPEIDMPGHVVSVLAGYPQYSCTGDRINVATMGGIYDDIFCAGSDEVFDFIYAILDDVCELFPGKYFHIGGDEAPKTRWKTCPKCMARMQKLGLSSMQELQGWFMNKVAEHLKKLGKTAIVWNEAAYGGNLSTDVVVQKWTADRSGKLDEWVARGGKVINSIVENCYCDYPYGLRPLKTMYELDMNGENIIGNECLLWTEYVRDALRLETLAWPRYAASAEIGWSGKLADDYAGFEERLKKILSVFDKYDINITEEEGWNPGPEAAEKEKQEFYKNFQKGLFVGEGAEEEV